MEFIEEKEMLRTLTTFMFCALLAVALSAPVSAQDDPRDYLLGTQLIIKSPIQLTDPNMGWWAELLPMEYNYAQGTIIKVVNEARVARGVTEMIDYKSYPIGIGGEMPADRGYEYNIDFNKLTPADVEVVLANFPFSGVLSDLQQELRPIKTGWFNANGPEGTATLTIFGESETFTRDDSFNTARQKADALLTRVFGHSVPFDMSFNNYFSLGGYSSLDISLTVYLEGYDQGMPGFPRPYEGEGGM
jgi:hypothetical protein